MKRRSRWAAALSPAGDCRSGLDLTKVALVHRRTKIVATLGPATSSEEAIRSLLEAGVDVVRVNFSHGESEGRAALVARVREAARALGKQVPILGDLSGPKIRVGRFARGAIELAAGERVVVTGRAVEGRPGLIPSRYRRLAKDVSPGDRLLLDDGKLELRVVGTRDLDVCCQVVQGGRLTDGKGINLPMSSVSVPSLTAKDRADAAQAVALGLDYLALSFVRSDRDLRQLRALLARHGARIPMVAKIEKPQALTAMGGILDVSDAVMVARGDLGVELPLEQVPIVQRQLVWLAMRRNRPVIVATQMLESMIENSRATRAEVSDVANAAFAGADAVMLSAETATGKHPLEAVRLMDRILREVEGYLWLHGAFESRNNPLSEAPEERLQDALARATAQLSRDLEVRCIAVPTRTGTTARSVSADRPAAPVLAFSADERVCRRLGLCWGVVPTPVRDSEMGDPEATARRLCRDLGFASRGERVLLVRGLDPDPQRSLPTLTVLTV